MTSIFISRARRIGYGVAEMGANGAEVMLRVSLLIFYTTEVGLRPDYASYALAIGVAWDALTDPFMGNISDRADFQGERRRPFFLPGAFGLAISLALVFNVPNYESQLSKFFYLLATYISTNTFMTILSVPHIALAGDMTNKENIRLELFAWRIIFANLGLIAGTAAPAIAISYASFGLPADSISSIAVAILILICSSVTFIATKGLDKQAPEKPIQVCLEQKKTYLEQLISVLKNQNFRRLLLAYMVATIGLTLNASIAIYYYKYFLQLDEITVRGIIAFFMMIFCFSIPGWIWLAQKKPKHKVAATSLFLLGLMTSIGYPLFPPKAVIWPVIAGLVGGILVGAVILMDVLVADCADQKANQSGETTSNLGLYFGFWKMGAKLSRAIALILTGNILVWIGFQTNMTTNENTLFYLALLFGPGVGLFLLLSSIIVFFAQTQETYK